MFINKPLSLQNLGNFNFEETKKNINDYFMNLERLQWEYKKLNAQKGLTVNYDFSNEIKKQPYIPIGKDVFTLSAKETKEEQLKKYISSYYWAKSMLSDMEEIYITESFINHKYQDELVDILGFNSRDNNEFRRLRRSAIYKFADLLNLIVEKEQEVKNVKCNKKYK